MKQDGESRESVKTDRSEGSGLRLWQVAGGLVTNTNSELLVVNNRRRDGSADWSPPGGVVDPGESPIEALAREVEEETGLVVSRWSETLYRVTVTAPDRGFELEATIHGALGYAGSIKLADPDGIVFEAEFCDPEVALQRLKTAPRWVSEPVQELLRRGSLEDGFSQHGSSQHGSSQHSSGEGVPVFEYLLEGSSKSQQRVTRIEPRIK